MRVRQLLLQAAWMRLTQEGEPDEWTPLLTYFERSDNRLRLGQTLYYKGVAFALCHEGDSCEYYLRQVGSYADVLSPHYMGMANYRLGVLSEEQGNYAAAFSRFADAQPFLREAADSLLLSCCCRDMARMSYVLGHDSMSAALFDEAQSLAAPVHNEVLSLDIAIQEAGNALAVDSVQLLQLYQTLGREGRRQRLEEKAEEMTILQEHLITERGLRIQRHLGIWLLSALGLCVLLALGVFRVRWQREQYKQQISKMEQDKLRQDLDSKREVLRSRLRERVSMRDSGMNWEDFYVEFDDAYDGLLSDLRTHYPDLTDIDVRYIALTCLHFDTADISLLLDLSKRTIYNRRQTLKQRLGLSSETLDVWLTSFSQRAAQ